MKKTIFILNAIIFCIASIFAENDRIDFKRNLFLIEYSIDGKQVEPIIAYKLMSTEFESKKMLDKSARLKMLCFGMLLTGTVIDIWQVSSNLSGNRMSIPIFSLGITLGLSGIGVAYWSDQVEIDAVRKYNENR